MPPNEQPQSGSPTASLTATIQPRAKAQTQSFTLNYPKLNVWRLLDPYLPLLEIKRRAEAHHKPTRLHSLVGGFQSLVVGPITFMASEGRVMYRRRLPNKVYIEGPHPAPNFMCEACGRQRLISSGMVVVDTGPEQFASIRYMLCGWCEEHGALDGVRKDGWWLRLS